MTRLLCGALLLFASISMAQQQGDPPYATPPTFPQDPKLERPMPPDTRAPRPDPGISQSEATSIEIAEKIQQKLDTEPLLKSSTLKVAVDDHSATLKGTVNSKQQREVALSILALYVGKREIVDQTKLRS
jgi:hypothetical protein